MWHLLLPDLTKPSWCEHLHANEHFSGLLPVVSLSDLSKCDLFSASSHELILQVLESLHAFLVQVLLHVEVVSNGRKHVWSLKISQRRIVCQTAHALDLIMFFNRVHVISSIEIKVYRYWSIFIATKHYVSSTRWWKLVKRRTLGCSSHLWEVMITTRTHELVVLSFLLMREQELLI